MLDLEAANALLEVVARTGADIALVGDQHQALPVGHSGAMALFWRRASRQVELLTIHRFKDPSWADLTIRLRSPGIADAGDVADELIRGDHVILTSSEAEAHDAMASAWFEANRSGQVMALVTATHAEAQTLSESIQARRISEGALDTRQAVSGQAGQPIFVGDVVQTRRNDSAAGVQNRQNWLVRKVGIDHVLLESANDSLDLRKVTLDYAESHLHLAYATTVYGVQGETTDLSIVGPGVDAAGLYVGLTRGKDNNQVVIVAPTNASARARLVEAMQRHPVEDTLEKSRTAARIELTRAAHGSPDPIASAQAMSQTAPSMN